MRRQYSQLTRDKTQWQIMWESASPSQRSQMENFLKELILAVMLYFPASNGKIYNYRQYIVTEVFGIDRKTYLAAKQDLLESRMITASNRLTKKGQMTKIRDIQSLLFDLNEGTENRYCVRF